MSLFFFKLFVTFAMFAILCMGIGSAFGDGDGAPLDKTIGKTNKTYNEVLFVTFVVLCVLGATSGVLAALAFIWG